MSLSGETYFGAFTKSVVVESSIAYFAKVIQHNEARSATPETVSVHKEKVLLGETKCKKKEEQWGVQFDHSDTKEAASDTDVKHDNHENKNSSGTSVLTSNQQSAHFHASRKNIPSQLRILMDHNTSGPSDTTANRHVGHFIVENTFRGDVPSTRKNNVLTECPIVDWDFEMSVLSSLCASKRVAPNGLYPKLYRRNADQLKPREGQSKLDEFPTLILKALRDHESCQRDSKPMMEVIINLAKFPQPEEVIRNCYYKAHMTMEGVQDLFEDQLPSGFQVKRSAVHPAIMFSTTHQAQADTHFDPDPILLFLLSGTKEIFLAPKSIITSENLKQDEQRMAYYDVDPHAEPMRGWLEKVVMKPYDALLIPAGWLHSIKSSAGTVAVSLQWEGALLQDTEKMADNSTRDNVNAKLAKEGKQEIQEGKNLKADLVMSWSTVVETRADLVVSSSAGGHGNGTGGPGSEINNDTMVTTPAQGSTRKRKNVLTNRRAKYRKVERSPRFFFPKCNMPNCNNGFSESGGETMWMFVNKFGEAAAGARLVNDEIFCHQCFPRNIGPPLPAVAQEDEIWGAGGKNDYKNLRFGYLCHFDW